MSDFWTWLGYGIAAVLAMLLGRVLMSDPHLALRRMTEALNDARATIDKLKETNTRLQNHNGELSVQVHRLQADNRDLHQQLQLLQQAKEIQAQTLERMERYQRELQDKHDNMVARVMHLEAKLGML